MSQIKGSPLTCSSFFVAGYDYVALYRMQPHPSHESLGSPKETLAEALQPRHARWSIEIVNLVDARRWLSVRTPSNSTSASLPQRGQLRADGTKVEEAPAPPVRDAFSAAPEVMEAIAWRASDTLRETHMK